MELLIAICSSFCYYSSTMPNLKSAKKRLRQNIKKEAKNKALKRRVRDVIRLVEKNTSEESRASAQKVIDKAAKVGVFHKNKASHLKSKLAKLRV